MINVTHLTRHFDQRGIAGLHSLSFSLAAGEVMGILGPNGSGKTTLLRMLSGSITPDGGEFTIDGTVSFFPPGEIFPAMNVQKFLVSSITLDVHDEKKIQLARDLADTFEFTFQLRQNLDELSSGQKQKVLLARELINRPSLLLMDEPFTHLDPYTRKDILRGLFDYIRHQQITVLWVTHDLEEAFEFSDKIGILNFGKLEQLTSPEEIIKKPKNLFVAKFIGYRNFFPVKATENGLHTPWGTIQKLLIPGPEGLLVIPDHAWEVADKEVTFTIVSSHPIKQMMEYKLSYENRSAYMVRGAQTPSLSTADKISLSPIWSECFCIPL